MLLVGVKEENGWLCSQWNLTYGTGWTESGENGVSLL